MKLLKLSDKAYEQYRTKVKGNENITRDQASKKITRNVLLAKEVPPRYTLDRLLGSKLYHYGNLHIIVRWGKVLQIYNHFGGQYHNDWVLDKEKYIKLTKELGIEDSKY